MIFTLSVYVRFESLQERKMMKALKATSTRENEEKRTEEFN